MRVLVMRPRPQGDVTAARLAALGHDALAAPLLIIEPTGEEPPGGPFDALIVTSANAVPALGAFDTALPVFAVGARTAALARAKGFAAVRSVEGDAEDLAALVARSLPAGARPLHVAGRDHKPEPRASLAQAGFTVETFVAYEAVPVKVLPERMDRALREDSLQAALHYSRRTAETALALTSAAGRAERFLALPHVCLSRDVAAPLRTAGAARLIVAEAPAEASLFAALALCDSSP